MIKKDIPQHLPDEPGIYFFRKGKRKTSVPLYIGKATSLRDRVRSYFVGNLEKARGPAITRMLSEAKSVDVVKTDSVLEALLLETSLIKREKPKYNVTSRDDKSYNHVVITKEDFPRILLRRTTEIEGGKHGEEYRYSFGPFPKGGDVKIALSIIRKIFPFRDKCKPHSGKPCFNRQIGLCPGVCSREVSKRDYNATIRNIRLLFDGKKREIVKNLEGRMSKLAEDGKFEDAAAVRNQIFALNHIEDIALLKRDKRVPKRERFRIEAFDISHISGAYTAGAMVVWQDGDMDNREYRKFKIRWQDKNDDVGNLKEVLKRRFSHREWRMPNIVVVDGGRAQINGAKNILAHYKLSLPVVGVAKDERHKASKVLGLTRVIAKYNDEIIMANSESHRFAIKYHRILRARGMKR